MGTRSITRVHDGDLNSKVILTIYRHFDGYFEGHGEELKKFLIDMVMTNGLSSSNKGKVANGIGCLAAQIVAHFKEGSGGIYIIDSDLDQNEEYNYDVYLNDNDKICLVGENEHNESLTFIGDDETQEFCERVAEFVYPDANGVPHWRKIDLVEMNGQYVMGFDSADGNKFKKFCISKVIGGADRVLISDKGLVSKL